MYYNLWQHTDVKCFDCKVQMKLLKSERNVIILIMGIWAKKFAKNIINKKDNHLIYAKTKQNHYNLTICSFTTYTLMRIYYNHMYH